MKVINVIVFISIAILMIGNSGCKKDPGNTQASVSQPPPPPPPPPPPSQPPPNTPPKCFAGQDQLVFFPSNFCSLSGSAYDMENNIGKVLWRKLSGPSSFLIEHPDSISTKISNLEIGVYEFTLTVTDSLGLFGNDTVKVTVTSAKSTINAGTDKLVYYPTNFTNLHGSMSGALQTITWSKISGPPSFFIETPNSLGTKVSNLEIGVYQFELFQGNAALSNRDTCTVVVNQMSDTPKEILFTNQVWVQDGLLWGSAITIKNVYQNLPVGRVFRVYIRKDNAVNWDELLIDDNNSWYMFYLLNGNLYIYSNYDETDTPDIKLVY